MTQPITEVREADASAEVRAIFNEIKTASGTPQVNLIWRHFATEPDVLKWAWQSIGPVVRSGRIAQEAAGLRATVRDVVGAGDAARSEPVWADLDPHSADSARNVVAYYNLGNAQNLIALTALIAAARGPGDVAPPFEAPAFDAEAPQPGLLPRALPPVPPLPRKDTLPPGVADAVTRLAARHGGAKQGVTPSLYLHVSIWPSTLARLDAIAAPWVGTDAFDQTVQTVIEAAGARAERVSQIIRSAKQWQAPHGAMTMAMLATLEGFVATTIPEMIVVGARLSALDARDE